MYLHEVLLDSKCAYQTTSTGIGFHVRYVEEYGYLLRIFSVDRFIIKSGSFLTMRRLYTYLNALDQAIAPDFTQWHTAQE